MDCFSKEILEAGLIKWYTFRDESKICLIGDIALSYNAYFTEKGFATFSDLAKGEYYDYIIAISVLENSDNPQQELLDMVHHLKDDGHLLLGFNNKLALRFFCGDSFPFSRTNYDYLDGLGTEKSIGHLFTLNDIRTLLGRIDILKYQAYTVLPSLEYPQLIYSHNTLPEEDLALRYIPIYNDNSGIIMDEGNLYKPLIENGCFHEFGNTYLIDCTINGDNIDIDNVTLALDRGRKYATITIVKNNGVVEKKAVYPEGIQRLKQLVHNHQEIRKAGIDVVPTEWSDGKIIMPKIEAKLANIYLQELLEQDVEKFLKELDKFCGKIYQSSEIIDKNEYGAILKHGYFDMVPLNAFYDEGEYIFFDQEFVIDKFPAAVMIYRTIVIIYDDKKEREMIYPSYKLYERYGLTEHLAEYNMMSQEFLKNLRNQEELVEFGSSHYKNLDIILHNRELIASKNNDNIRDDCFLDIKSKKIVVFGSGKYADKFIALYRSECDIVAVVDNAQDKQGNIFRGILIQSPEILRAMNSEYFKVIICVKEYTSIYNQLLEMGIKNIGVYEYSRVYNGRQNVVKMFENSDKKYHIGYCAGVYDLFHIGHLNIFKRAKELCDYLVVGVVSDECVRNNKHREPFIPFEERLEIVRACRYVDEVVEVPYGYERSIEAFEKIHFDCQFSGSDYEHDEGWLYVKKWLEERGATMEFLPYTEQTSSTKIKCLIDANLI